MKKIYLNTVEEITKALSEGKEVFVEDIEDKIEKHKKIKLVNNILVCYALHYGEIYINDYFNFNNEINKFYYEEKEPIKLEIGKFYKTRNGRQVVCISQSINKDKNYPYTFIFLNKGTIIHTAYSGELVIGEEHNGDIVDYWEEQ